MSLTAKRRTREARPTVASDGAILGGAADDRARSGLSRSQVSAPPADLITSDRLKGVRFDLAQPRGYYTEQVDTLVKLLTSSLAWHEEALYQRDQGIHVLQTDLDAAIQQEATLRAQVEVFRVQGSVTVGEDGQILRKSQVTAANEALAEARGATAAVGQRLSASIEEVRSLREWADIVIPQTAQIAELARVAQEQLEVAVQELATDRQQSADMTAQVAALESQVAALESQVASLESQQLNPSAAANVMAPTIAGPPESVTLLVVPVLTTPVRTLDGQDTIDTAESEWNLDDPELPVGVTLPRAKYDREYIVAQQGDPLLVNRRSPLAVWAPELFTNQEVTPAAEQTIGAPVQDDGWGEAVQDDGWGEALDHTREPRPPAGSRPAWPRRAIGH